MESFLSTIMPVLSHFLVGLLLFVGYIAAYITVTPQNDFQALHAGSKGAAWAFIGAALGFIIPLGSLFASKPGIVAILLWAVIIAAINLVTFYVTHIMGDRLGHRAATGCEASGLVLGGANLFVGLLLANGFFS